MQKQMKTWTKEQLAELLNGNEYLREMTKEQAAKESICWYCSAHRTTCSKCEGLSIMKLERMTAEIPKAKVADNT